MNMQHKYLFVQERKCHPTNDNHVNCHLSISVIPQGAYTHLMEVKPGDGEGRTHREKDQHYTC